MARWTIPVAIPNQTSKTASALALIEGRVHLIHLGESSDNLWHSVWDGARWSDNVSIGGLSRGRVALANDGLMVYVGGIPEHDPPARGITHRLFQGVWLPTKQPPDHPTTLDPPAAVRTPYGTWLVVWQKYYPWHQLAYSTYQHAGGDVLTKVDGGLLPQLSKKVPALASDATGIHMIYLHKSSNNLWHAWGGGDQQIPNQSSRDVPAAAFHNGVLHMTHIGESSDRIWHSTFAGGQWTPNVPIPDHLSNQPPAMCSAPDGLHMVHKGAGSDRIWHSIYR